MDDTVAEVRITATLGIYPLIHELGGFSLIVTRDSLRYWNTGRKLALEQAIGAIGQILDEIKTKIDKQNNNEEGQ